MANSVFLKSENITHKLFNNCKEKWNVTKDKFVRFKQIINLDLTCDLLTLQASWETIGSILPKCYGQGVA